MRILYLVLTLALGVAGQASAQTIDRIRETGELKIGYRTDAAPISYANEDGNAAGYSVLVCVTLAQALAQNLEMEDLNVTFHKVTGEDRFDKVASGEIDLLCGTSTITLERRKLVDFSIPTYVDGAIVLLPRNGNPSFQSLDGKKIGVRSNTTTARALTNTIASTGISAEEVAFDSYDGGIEALKNGEIDAFFGDQSIIVHKVNTLNLGSELRLTNQLLTVEKQGLALARGDSEFRLLVDQILSAMYQNGFMKRIYEQTLPNLQPGQAMQALHMIAPEIP
ncbi:amino acid ABC transporter substrate-binding protein [Aliiruegeria lutimaris]|uniref:Amino acid ABC transporter substrate-binding protein, PAAT family n=1 Tax=Aliiruegeria lutimaris TaxID=571298 RepID=A0A1G8Q940_9RHOB|nr:amino acid ABC transporter substrate-binding protein [Aliiruegeria lutimaris]SDJ01339.1 amino acid ABC transporter substrate-binding protein, PAAT family [Aliiruegeria lutimaris]